MSEFSAELGPSSEHFTELLARLLTGVAVRGCTGAIRVLGPPSRLRAVILEDSFDGGTGERCIEPLF